MADFDVCLQHTISTHTGDITSVAFADGKLATASSDRSLCLWSVEDFSQCPPSPLLGHAYNVQFCTFNHDGSTIASCSTDGKMILWDVRSGEKMFVVHHPSMSSIRTCRFSPDSSRIATGSDDDTIRLWAVASGHLIR